MCYLTGKNQIANGSKLLSTSFILLATSTSRFTSQTITIALAIAAIYQRHVVHIDHGFFRFSIPRAGAQAVAEDHAQGSGTGDGIAS